jgi:hypothetical protein
MEHVKTPDMDPLLTPREAAQRLLEEATKTAIRTGGAAGLRPVVVDGRRMFRFSDVDSLARIALAA